MNRGESKEGKKEKKKKKKGGSETIFNSTEECTVAFHL